MVTLPSLPGSKATAVVDAQTNAHTTTSVATCQRCPSLFLMIFSYAGSRARSQRRWYELLPRGEQGTWARQHVGLQDLVEPLLRQELLFQHELIDAPAGGQRLLRDFGGIGIADVGIE